MTMLPLRLGSIGHRHTCVPVVGITSPWHRLTLFGADQLHACVKLYTVTMQPRTTKVAPQIATSEEQLASFIDKFDPKHAALIRSLRKALRTRLPTARCTVLPRTRGVAFPYA
jgi:hypothetical protein